MNAQIEPTSPRTEVSSGRLCDIIVGHPFLKGVNPRYVHLLTERASFVCFGLGQNIFREGEDADHFYLVHKGQVALETFVPRVGLTTIQTIGAEEALGWSWLYPPYLWQFSARAIEPVEAVAFGAMSLREHAEENHDFGYDLTIRVGRVMLARLQATRRRLLEFYTPEGSE